MRILGIDPGTSIIGYGIINVDKGEMTCIKQGVITTEKNLATSERVCDIFNFLTALLKKEEIDTAAVEKLFFFKNAKTVIQVSEIRGVILLALRLADIEVREFTPLQVKQAVSSYGKATKQQVQQMVKLILSLKEIPKPDDVADALAIAICCANTATVDNS